MPNPINRFLFLPLFLFLISTSLFQPKWLVSASSLPEKRLNRPDPLQHFKHYNGGFDLQDKHYLASAAFTGVHGYAIAGVWLLCGLAFAIFMIFKCLCGGSASLPFKDCLDHYYPLLFLLILFLTSLAIVASSLSLVTSHKSLRRTEQVRDSVMGIGEDALVTLSRVIKKMKQMQYLLLPYNHRITGDLNTTIDNFRSNSRAIRRFVHTSGSVFERATHTSYVAHVVVVSINLVMLTAALVLLLLHWRPGFITIIFCCWMLTALCWVMTGFDFFLHTFAADATFAFEEFEQNPQNNSLSSMLPCMDDSDSQKLMTKIGFTIHEFIAEILCVSQLNAKMSEIYRLLGIEEHTQKILGIMKICEPFTGPPNYTYIPNGCPENAIRIGDLPKILETLTCHEEERREECKREGRIVEEASYNIAHAYSRSIQDFLDIYPDLENLSKCSFVKNKVSDVLLQQCRTLKFSIRLLWASMLSLSIIMFLLVLASLADAFLCWDKSLSIICSRTPTP